MANMVRSGDDVEQGMLDEGTEDEKGSLKEGLAERLDALGRTLSETRKDAIDWRAELDIEGEWSEDEEAYNGIDDHNRAEMSSAYQSKSDPLGTTGRRRSSARADGDTRSTIVPNITGPYCDAAAARLSDMVLPTDEQPFEIAPTTISDMEEMLKDHTPIQIMGDGGQIIETTRAKHVAGIIKEAKEPARRAEKVITDWFDECNWTNEVRQVIEDAARIGTGVLKGPVPVKVCKFRWDKKNGFDVLTKHEEVRPESYCVSVWNVFPARDCGESIHNGPYIWEVDTLTKRQLQDMKGDPGYIDSQIDACLQEGPLDVDPYWRRGVDAPEPLKSSSFQVWYYYGSCKRDDWLAAQPIPMESDAVLEMMDKYQSMTDDVQVCATMVNHRCIKMVLAPLDDGEFPYDFMVWRKRRGLPYGQGIARQINPAQRMVTAGTRNLMDNAGIGGGPIIVADPDVIEPADGKWTLYSRKFFLKKEGATMQQAKEALFFQTVDMVTNELIIIINLGFRFAEEITGLPAILQGQLGEKAPDRVGIVQMLQENGSATLRRLAKLFDDRVVEPHVTRYYNWLMHYGEDEMAKGDFAVKTRGATALAERALQNGQLSEVLLFSKDPDYGLDPERVMKEWLRARRIDPSRLEIDEQERQRRREAGDPLRLAEVALKRADATLKSAQASKIDAEKLQANVTSQYTAVQTGQTIASVPQVAAVADTVIRNAADGLDKTDSLGSPEGQNVSVPAQQIDGNTSPEFPPNPESPEVGLADGIETQGNDGVIVNGGEDA